LPAGYADSVSGGAARIGVIFGLAVALIGGLWIWMSSRIRRIHSVCALSALALAVLFAAIASDVYRREKGQNPQLAAIPAAAWAWDAPEGTRIAFTGFPINWHLYGKGMTNHVAYLGRTLDDGSFVALETCEDYRAAVNEGGYTHIVTLPHGLFDQDSPERGWAQSDRSAVPVDSVWNGTVFALQGRLDPDSCPAE
jgi:hypothetical protein